ncbi:MULTISPECIES: phosphate signaling complex protein PhoU [unclassified Arthrobacter]|uniref:phosphate signaling complex protein PhoU n=1 Tax=unclassified Arthrobacter TaxID=235627 RepID=UPI001D1576FD|nr:MULTISPECIES: phosphate signaling complex protein PhoU [unclassified Arthrobacter]MCC3302574.1 phosphate signaling complex protein PhoU [Arthrobacter sp. zg-Y895]MCQ1988039.1 phosphate signaling complex protein PhoU [Arthrobacter sp. zg-Y844]MCC3292341.1 phosphate signaling complex protein PhoU [Arthrobacter sp. zg-Y1110]MCQ1996674.1 phosphate signaling complex protein PhoU [Arthrobacter sp. zg-Y1171]UWX82271.1 phosphate signaling complex protein PhoU [Arthrobacter sp. zg-Y1171]
MRKVFQAELHQIGEELTQISQLVTEAMRKATLAFEGADIELAQDVIAADARIDFLQNDLDERAIDVLALQGPVASDLRMIVGSLRMSASLERMGDLARHIAQLARLRYPANVVPDNMVQTFREMAQLDIRISEQLTELLETRNLEMSKDIYEANSRINELHAGVFKSIASPDWNVPAVSTVDLTLASRYFERFADHGVSVTRKVNYLVTGEWHPLSESGV